LGNVLILMDKETLIKLAQPAATLCLALSILSLPLIVKAASLMYVEGSTNARNYPIYVKIVN